jgi:hypothetical protein
MLIYEGSQILKETFVKQERRGSSKRWETKARGEYETEEA